MLLVKLWTSPTPPVALVTMIVLRDDAAGAQIELVPCVDGCGWDGSEGQVINISVNREGVGPI